MLSPGFERLPFPPWTNDYADGAEGNDSMWSNEFGQWLRGGTGDDVILGNGGDDKLDGEDGDDLIFGGIGDDTIQGGQGADTLVGGEGDDLITVEGSDLVFGGAGADHFSIGLSGGTVVIADYDPLLDGLLLGTGGVGDAERAVVRITVLDETDAKMTIIGNGVLTTVVLHGAVLPDGRLALGDVSALRATLEIDTGGRALFLPGDLVADLIAIDTRETIAEPDAALFILPFAPEVPQDGSSVIPSEGADRIVPEPGAPLRDRQALGLGGNDTIWGRREVGHLEGNDGDDVLIGGGYNNVLLGGLGDDLLFGAAGLDRLVGADGADTMVGGRDDDTIEGGAGDDVMFGGSGADHFLFSGTGGHDTIVDYQADRDWIRLGDRDSAVRIEVVNDHDALMTITSGAAMSTVLLHGAVRPDGVLEVGRIHALGAGTELTIVAPDGYIQPNPMVTANYYYSSGSGFTAITVPFVTLQLGNVDAATPSVILTAAEIG